MGVSVYQIFSGLALLDLGLAAGVQFGISASILVAAYLVTLVALARPNRREWPSQALHLPAAARSVFRVRLVISRRSR